MGAGAIVVVGIGANDTAKMRFAKNQDMVQAFSSDRADEPFYMSFCQGERGAVGRSLMPMAAERPANE